MLSSLNHHLRILKFQVHSAYLEYLRSGSLPSAEAPSDWSAPVIQRSRWYDLFSVEDRKEALRGVWGVMGYMAREIDEKADEPK
jgi:hypothetical protein